MGKNSGVTKWLLALLAVAFAAFVVWAMRPVKYESTDAEPVAKPSQPAALPMNLPPRQPAVAQMPAALPPITTQTLPHGPITIPTPTAADIAAAEQFHKLFLDLAMVSRAVQVYYRTHRALPDSLDQLTTPVVILARVPVDRFAPGRPLSYMLIPSRVTNPRVSGPQKTAVLYSVGPDRKDDKGALFNLVPNTNPLYFEKQAATMKGDIGCEIGQADLEVHNIALQNNLTVESLAQVSRREFDNRYLEELLKLRATEKRDNALIYYTLACWVATPGSSEEGDLINQVLRNGCSEEQAIWLRPYLLAFQPAFEQIRKGAALDHATGIGFPRMFATPVPNFLAAQTCARALCAEGRLLEMEGKYDDALRDYLVVLTMGRDYGTPGSTSISYLMSWAIDHISITRIHRLVVSGNLPRASLLQLQARLQQIERTQGSSADAIRSQGQAMSCYFQRAKTHPDEIMKLRMATRSDPNGDQEDPALQLPPRPDHNFTKEDKFLTRAFIVIGDEIDYQGRTLKKRMEIRQIRKAFRQREEQVRKDVDSISRNADELDQQHQKFVEMAARYSASPYWRRDPEQYKRDRDALIASFPELLKNSPSANGDNSIDADTRYLIVRSRLLQAELATALELYRVDKGRYPDSIKDLKPAYAKYLPADPFSGNDFAYQPATDKKSYQLRGSGPDIKTPNSTVRYDPTNGTLSPGTLGF